MMAKRSSDLAKASLNAAKLNQNAADLFTQRTWKMLYGLTPADWWNDAIMLPVTGRAALNELAMIQASQSYGAAFARALLGVKGNAVQLIYPRFNTTPWLKMMAPIRQYRAQAVKRATQPASWLDDSLADYAKDRLDLIVRQDAQASMNQQSLRDFRADGIPTYVRVLHPELSRTGSCGLCAVASTRLYNTANLIPMHDRCVCGVAPWGEEGLRLRTEDLKKVYAEAGPANRKNLAEVRVRFDSHGELGEVLSVGDAKKEGSDKPIDVLPPDVEKTQTQLRRMYDHAVEFERRYRQLIAGVGDTYQRRSKRDRRRSVSGFDDNGYLRFRFDGHSYVFKPMSMDRMQQAMRWNRRNAQRISALIYQRAA